MRPHRAEDHPDEIGAAKRAERARRKKEKAAQIEAPLSTDNAEVGLVNLDIDESDVAMHGATFFYRAELVGLGQAPAVESLS